MTLFKETDDIIRLGKWAYKEIPHGSRCGHCPLLGEVVIAVPKKTTYYCQLRHTIALMFDEDGPFKDEQCPIGKQEKKA